MKDESEIQRVIELEAATLPMMYKCGDCGSRHQFKDMIDHKAGCVYYE